MANTFAKIVNERAKKKVGKVMGEFKQGTLHSGKGGPVVTNPKQAVAIALAEGRRKQASPRYKS